MTRSPMRLMLSIALFCTAFLLQTAQAEQSTITTPDQLAIELPDVDREALVDQLRTLRSRLIQRKQTLVQEVADKKMDSGDAVITVIMPGGLIYAGYKKARYEQAKNELDRVTLEIEEFSKDLLAMQSTSIPVVVAQLP